MIKKIISTKKLQMALVSVIALVSLAFGLIFGLNKTETISKNIDNKSVSLNKSNRLSTDKLVALWQKFPKVSKDLDDSVQDSFSRNVYSTLVYYLLDSFGVNVSTPTPEVSYALLYPNALPNTTPTATQNSVYGILDRKRNELIINPSNSGFSLNIKTYNFADFNFNDLEILVDFADVITGIKIEYINRPSTSKGRIYNPDFTSLYNATWIKKLYRLKRIEFVNSTYNLTKNQNENYMINIDKIANIIPSRVESPASFSIELKDWVSLSKDALDRPIKTSLLTFNNNGDVLQFDNPQSILFKFNKTTPILGAIDSFSKIILSNDIEDFIDFEVDNGIYTNATTNNTDGTQNIEITKRSASALDNPDPGIGIQSINVAFRSTGVGGGYTKRLVEPIVFRNKWYWNFSKDHFGVDYNKVLSNITCKVTDDNATVKLTYYIGIDQTTCNSFTDAPNRVNAAVVTSFKNEDDESYNTFDKFSSNFGLEKQSGFIDSYDLSSDFRDSTIKFFLGNRLDPRLTNNPYKLNINGNEYSYAIFQGRLVLNFSQRVRFYEEKSNTYYTDYSSIPEDLKTSGIISSVWYRTTSSGSTLDNLTDNYVSFNTLYNNFVDNPLVIQIPEKDLENYGYKPKITAPKNFGEELKVDSKTYKPELFNYISDVNGLQKVSDFKTGSRLFFVLTGNDVPKYSSFKYYLTRKSGGATTEYYFTNYNDLSAQFPNYWREEGFTSISSTWFDVSKKNELANSNFLESEGFVIVGGKRYYKNINVLKHPGFLKDFLKSTFSYDKLVPDYFSGGNFSATKTPTNINSVARIDSLFAKRKIKIDGTEYGLVIIDGVVWWEHRISWNSIKYSFGNFPDVYNADYIPEYFTSIESIDRNIKENSSRKVENYKRVYLGFTGNSDEDSLIHNAPRRKSYSLPNYALMQNSKENKKNSFVYYRGKDDSLLNIVSFVIADYNNPGQLVSGKRLYWKIPELPRYVSKFSEYTSYFSKESFPINFVPNKDYWDVNSIDNSDNQAESLSQIESIDEKMIDQFIIDENKISSYEFSLETGESSTGRKGFEGISPKIVSVANLFSKSLISRISMNLRSVECENTFLSGKIYWLCEGPTRVQDQFRFYESAVNEQGNTSVFLYSISSGSPSWSIDNISVIKPFVYDIWKKPDSIKEDENYKYLYIANPKTLEDTLNVYTYDPVKKQLVLNIVKAIPGKNALGEDGLFWDNPGLVSSIKIAKKPNSKIAASDLKLADISYYTTSLATVEDADWTAVNNEIINLGEDIGSLSYVQSVNVSKPLIFENTVIVRSYSDTALIVSIAVVGFIFASFSILISLKLIKRRKNRKII